MGNASSMAICAHIWLKTNNPTLKTTILPNRPRVTGTYNSLENKLTLIAKKESKVARKY